LNEHLIIRRAKAYQSETVCFSRNLCSTDRRVVKHVNPNLDSGTLRQM